MASRFSVGGGASWQTLVEVDFTALPNQALNSDGAHVIGGLTWYIENTANVIAGAVGMRIVNGVGLVLPCEANSGAQYYPLNRLEPLIRLPLPVVSNLQPMRAQMHVGQNLGWGDEVFLAFELPDSASRNMSGMRFNLDGGAFAASAWGCWQQRECGYNNWINASTLRVVGADIAGLLCPESCLPVFSELVENGVYAAGDWALPSALAPIGGYTGASAVTLGGNTTVAAQTAANYGVAMSVHFGSVDAAYEQVIRRFRICTYS